MSEKYYASKTHRDMVEREREYNLVRLQKLKELLDSGEVKSNKLLFIKNDLWEQNSEGYCIGFVACIGVECKIKSMSTKHECPLKPTKEGCWWIYAHEWRIANDKKRKGQPIKSIMRKRSEA